jgi:hypothetical protein
MIGSWEVPRIERVRAFEARRLGTLPVPGLEGDLHQDLGKGALAVEIAGSLSTDEARDTFLEELRDKFYAAEPVDFVADIVHEAQLEQVLIEAFEVEEVAQSADTFRYRLVLKEYTEPPPPPGLGLPGLDVPGLEDFDVPGLDLDVDLGLDLLDLPNLLGSVPAVGDLLSPVSEAAEGLKQTLQQAGTVLTPLRSLLSGGS